MHSSAVESRIHPIRARDPLGFWPLRRELEDYTRPLFVVLTEEDWRRSVTHARGPGKIHRALFRLHLHQKCIAQLAKALDISTDDAFAELKRRALRQPPDSVAFIVP